MDWMKYKSAVMEAGKKYRYVLLVLLAGILLMSLPESASQEVEAPEKIIEEEESLQASLSRILSKVSGAGRVEVLLTEQMGAEKIYQTDEDRAAGETSSDVRRETVLVTSANREETGLLRRTDPPAYQGAVILCQGADDPRVKLSMVEAVANATGLTTDRISVLKMK